MDYREIEDDIIEKYWKAKLEFDRENRTFQYKQGNGIKYDSSKITTLGMALDDLIKQLIELPEKPATQAKQHNLIQQLGYIYQSLILNEDGYKISRNQGLILPNYIYGDIINDLKWAFKSRYSAVTMPIYHYSHDSNFDHSPVKDLISTCIVELKNKRFEDFPSLYNQFVVIINSIDEIGASEYADNKDK